MNAVILAQYGGPEALVFATHPNPTPAFGEVLIDVKAASINGADYKVRRGLGGALDFPYVLGRDFSGIVSGVGPGVSDIRLGEEVFGVLDQGQEGAYAEKLVVKAAIIARKPKWLSHVEAASVALTGLTALWAIEDTAALQAGESILIHGGSGGVGSFAIQVARFLKADIATTASAENIEYVKMLGATQVVDYANEDFTEVVSPCDVVFDTVGGEVQVRSYDVLKPGGRLVRITAAPEGFEPSRLDVKVLRPAVTRSRGHLERIVDLLHREAVRPPNIKCFRLREASEAHRISETRHLRGKLVFDLSLG